MKRLFLVPVLMISIQSANSAVVADKMHSVCELKITGNDYEGGPEDLEEFEAPKREYSFTKKVGVSGFVLDKFKRVIPYADTPADYHKYQIVDFRDEEQRLQNLLDSGIELAQQKIFGEFKVTVIYDGIVKKAGKKVRKVTMKYTNNFRDYAIQGESKQYTKTLYFDIGVKEPGMDFPVPVKFKFDDFGRDGVIGGIVDHFADDLNEEDKAKRETHESVARVKCQFSFTDKEDEEEEIEPKLLQSRFAGEVIRPGNAIRN